MGEWWQQEACGRAWQIHSSAPSQKDNNSFAGRRLTFSVEHHRFRRTWTIAAVKSTDFVLNRSVRQFRTLQRRHAGNAIVEYVYTQRRKFTSQHKIGRYKAFLTSKNGNISNQLLLFLNHPIPRQAGQ